MGSENKTERDVEKVFKGVPEGDWVVGPCKTREEAKEVLRIAHGKGYKWNNGISFLEKDSWDEYKEKMCYSLLDGMFCSVNFFKRQGFTLISPGVFIKANSGEAFEGAFEGAFKGAGRSG